MDEFHDENGRIAKIGDRVRVIPDKGAAFWGILLSLAEHPKHGVVAEVESERGAANRRTVPARFMRRASDLDMAAGKNKQLARQYDRAAIKPCKRRS